jgi:hypothetical protein
MKTESNSDTEWASIISAATDVAYAYRNLIKASDTLAQRINRSEDYVLLRVLPRRPIDRRLHCRIIRWVVAEKDTIIAALEKDNRAFKREALIARLKLTPEEVALLTPTAD